MLYCCRVPRAWRKSSDRSPSVAVHDDEEAGGEVEVAASFAAASVSVSASEAARR